MDPINTLDHSDTSPVISGGCNTDCTRTPSFAEKPELPVLRVVTRHVHRPPQATTTTPSLEVALCYPRRGEGFALQRPSGPSRRFAGGASQAPLHRMTVVTRSVISGTVRRIVVPAVLA
jgi:hypothetical protein